MNIPKDYLKKLFNIAIAIEDATSLSRFEALDIMFPLPKVHFNTLSGVEHQQIKWTSFSRWQKLGSASFIKMKRFAAQASYIKMTSDVHGISPYNGDIIGWGQVAPDQRIEDRMIVCDKPVTFYLADMHPEVWRLIMSKKVQISEGIYLSDVTERGNKSEVLWTQTMIDGKWNHPREENVEILGLGEIKIGCLTFKKNEKGLYRNKNITLRILEIDDVVTQTYEGQYSYSLSQTFEPQNESESDTEEMIDFYEDEESSDIEIGISGYQINCDLPRKKWNDWVSLDGKMVGEYDDYEFYDHFTRVVSNDEAKFEEFRADYMLPIFDDSSYMKHKDVHPDVMNEIMKHREVGGDKWLYVTSTSFEYVDKPCGMACNILRICTKETFEHGIIISHLYDYCEGYDEREWILTRKRKPWTMLKVFGCEKYKELCSVQPKAYVDWNWRICGNEKKVKRMVSYLEESGKYEEWKIVPTFSEEVGEHNCEKIFSMKGEKSYNVEKKTFVKAKKSARGSGIMKGMHKEHFAYIYKCYVEYGEDFFKLLKKAKKLLKNMKTWTDLSNGKELANPVPESYQSYKWMFFTSDKKERDSLVEKLDRLEKQKLISF